MVDTCQGLISLGIWEAALYDCQLIAEGVLVEMGVTLGYFPNVRCFPNHLLPYPDIILLRKELSSFQS